MRPHERIAELELELKAANIKIAILRTRLLAADLETDAMAVSVPILGLTPQQACMMVALAAVYPRTLSVGYINDTLPRQDRAFDRDDNIVRVLVAHIRAKLGPDALETVRGQGYRISAQLAGQIKAVPAALARDGAA